jgi:predicted lipid-binding transport protein (Tim44 family)
MKRFATLLTIFFTCLTLFSTTAEARRMGGGGSFGKQRAVPTQPQRAPDAAPRQNNQPAQNTPPQQQQGNRWMGPLAGLAIGAGLGALFSNFLGGSGGAILLAILAAMVGVFLIRRFMQPKHTQRQFQAAQGPAAYEGASLKKPTFDIPPIGGVNQPLNDYAVASVPADFPVESFLRGAKATFIRLQAANDRKDLDDIREYTTPEVFAEIALQMQERGDAAQKTDVLKLDAQVLEVVDEGELTVVSVRFTGEIAESDGVPERFDEIWNVQRDSRSAKSGWMLAGIQQAVKH